MFQSLACAAGSIPGRDHVGSGRLLVGRNNQDAVYVQRDEHSIIALVCDGCGGQPHSECGAQLGARLTATALSRRLRQWLFRHPGGESPLWLQRCLEQARLDVLGHLRALAGGMGEELSHVIRAYFLFTVVGALVTTERTAIFSLGDGLFIVNGQLTELGPFPGNAPPYLGYDLPPGATTDKFRFQLQRVLPTAELESLLIGSDGVRDLLRAEGRRLPGRNEQVGPISQYWEDDRYFRNRDAIRRRLALINSEAVEVSAEHGRVTRWPGLLPDDTSFVVIRRDPAARGQAELPRHNFCDSCQPRDELA